MAIVVLLGVIVALLIHDHTFSSWGSTSVKGSGVAATQTRSVAPFTSIDLAGGNDVHIVVGAKQSVVLHGDDNLLGHVTTRVDGGRLTVGSSGSVSTRSPMRVDVTVPSLSALVLSGGGTIVAEDVRASELTLTLSGGGTLRVSGSAQHLDVSVPGAGSAQLDGLVVKDAHAVVAGAGVIYVRVTNTLDASVSGAGSILYTGNPAHVKSNITGVGAITPG